MSGASEASSEALQKSEHGEVLTELEFRALHANEHYHSATTFARRTLEEALGGGEHLAKARALFSEEDIRQGEWGRWLDNEFKGSRWTAQAWIRLYNGRNELGVRDRHAPLNISEALKMLAAPKEEKPPEPEDTNQVTVDEVLGEEPEEAENGSDESAWAPLVEEMEREKAAHAEAEEKARKESEAKKRAQQKAKDLGARLEASEESRKELAAIQRENMQAHIADIHARYNIPEVPEIFQATPGEFFKAVEGARTKREERAIDILFEAMKVVGKMMEYEPEEAARAFLRWHSQDRSVRGIKDMTKWMQKCVDELDQQTTPGTLRVMRKGE